MGEKWLHFDISSITMIVHFNELKKCEIHLLKMLRGWVTFTENYKQTHSFHLTRDMSTTIPKKLIIAAS